MGGWEAFVQLGISGVVLLVLYLVVRTGDLRTRYEAEAWRLRSDRAEEQVDRILPAMDRLTEQARSLTEQTKALTENTTRMISLVQRQMDREDAHAEDANEGRQVREARERGRPGR